MPWGDINMDKQTKLILALFVFVVGLLAANVGYMIGKREHNQKAWNDGFTACQEQF